MNSWNGLLYWKPTFQMWLLSKTMLKTLNLSTIVILSSYKTRSGFHKLVAAACRLLLDLIWIMLINKLILISYCVDGIELWYRPLMCVLQVHCMVCNGIIIRNYCLPFSFSFSDFDWVAFGWFKTIAGTWSLQLARWKDLVSSVSE